MNEIINGIILNSMEKSILFFLVSFLVMVYYYVELWYQSSNLKLLDYMLFNNPIGTYNAIKRLVMLTIGAGFIGHLDNVENLDIIISAAGIGWLAFSNRENKIENNQK